MLCIYSPKNAGETKDDECICFCISIKFPFFRLESLTREQLVSGRTTVAKVMVQLKVWRYPGQNNER